MFQIPDVANGFLGDRSSNGHDLVWFAGLQSGDYLSVVANFLQNLQKELFPENEHAVFSFSADSRRRFLPVEQGCSWKVFLAGVECGKMTVYASVPGYSIPVGVAPLLSINLRTIARLADSADFHKDVAWSPGISVSSLAVMNAWRVRTPEAGLSPAQIREEIERNSESGDNKPEVYLCHLLGTYGTYAGIINENPELMAMVADRLANLSGQISLNAGQAVVS